MKVEGDFNELSFGFRKLKILWNIIMKGLLDSGYLHLEPMGKMRINKSYNKVVTQRRTRMRRRAGEAALGMSTLKAD